MLMSAVSGAVSYRVVWRLRFCSSLSCLGLEVTGNCEDSVGGVDGGGGGWFEMAQWREEYAFSLRVLVGVDNMHLQPKSIELLVHKVESYLNVLS